MPRAALYLVLCSILSRALPLLATETIDVFDLVGLSDVSNSRKLLQTSICGAEEYFCGEYDMVLDTAYNAVLEGGCYNDTADTGMTSLS